MATSKPNLENDLKLLKRLDEVYHPLEESSNFIKYRIHGVSCKIDITQPASIKLPTSTILPIRTVEQDQEGKYQIQGKFKYSFEGGRTVVETTHGEIKPCAIIRPRFKIKVNHLGRR